MVSKVKVDVLETVSGSGNLVVNQPLSGSGASLTSLPAGNLTGTLPAIDGSNLTGLTSGYTELGVANTTSGSSSTIGSIPASVKTLLIVINKASCTGAAELNLQLGDAGGIETSGYASTTHKGDHTFSRTFYNDTAHFGLADGGSGADPFCTVMNLTRSASGVNDWIVTWITKQSTGAVNWGAGSKTLSGELTQINLLTNGTFDSGNWNAYYQ